MVGLRRFPVQRGHLLNKFISQASEDLVAINRYTKRGIEDVLGILITAIGPDFVCGEMPVDERTRQPFGLLHGGASIVLAESLGSYASHLVVSDDPTARVSGIEVSGSHVWSTRSGKVTGVARPVRLGRSLHFWQIDIRDQQGTLCCSARLTVKVKTGVASAD
jgi:1,4-dihydroxy-2-naphthoyl-CoA hydrolase